MVVGPNTIVSMSDQSVNKPEGPVFIDVCTLNTEVCNLSTSLNDSSAILVALASHGFLTQAHLADYAADHGVSSTLSLSLHTFLFADRVPDWSALSGLSTPSPRSTITYTVLYAR